MKAKNIDINHISKLANLILNKQEKEIFSKQLGNIIKYINNLNEVDTADIVPMSSGVNLINIFRDDVVSKGLKKENALRPSKNIHKDYFQVPLVLKNRDIK